MKWTNEIKMDHNNNDGFILGAIGGLLKFLFINIDASWVVRIGEASVTAFICGALGMAGKECFMWGYRKYKKAKSK